MKVKFYVNTEENPESPAFIMTEKEYEDYRRETIHEYTHDKAAFSEWLDEKYGASEVWYMDEYERKEIWDKWEKVNEEFFNEETTFICKELEV